MSHFFFPFLFFFLFLFVIYLIFTVLAFFIGGPFVPTEKTLITKIIELSQIEKGQMFIDFGSGDGRLLRAVCRVGGVSIGYEINPFWNIYSQLINLILGYGFRIKVYNKNFFHADLGQADVIYLYLFPDKIKELESFLSKNLKVGAKVITYKFPFAGWKSVNVLDREGFFLYRKEENS